MPATKRFSAFTALAATPADGDLVLLQDISDGNNLKRATLTELAQAVAAQAIAGLTASRLLATNGSKVLASVADLSSWIAGTTNQITVGSDGDGTVTLSLPQNIHTGASPTFAGLTSTAPVNGTTGVFANAGGTVTLDSNGQIETFQQLNVVGAGGRIYFYGYNNGVKTLHYQLESRATSTTVPGSDLKVYNDDTALIFTLDQSGNLTVTGSLTSVGGYVSLAEITTPGATADYGKIYCKADNKIYFQDGAGTEHEIAFV